MTSTTSSVRVFTSRRSRPMFITNRLPVRVPLQAWRAGPAAVELGAGGADVEVQLGDAADEVEVRARHLAGVNLAVVDRALRRGAGQVGDQLVVGVLQLELRDRGVVALDQGRARLGQG